MSNPQIPKEVQEALEDVRRIREMVDRSRAVHPIRLVLRPLMLFLTVTGPLIAGYGVLSQLALDGVIEPPGGLSRRGFLWLLGILTFVVVGALKAAVTAVATRREGYELSRLLGQVYSRDYIRVALPAFTLAAAASLAVARLGEPGMMVGLITAAVGLILIVIPLSLPLPEYTIFGAYLLLAGVAAIFAGAAVPFYSLAAVWGAGCLVFGLLGYFRFGRGD